jgi:hypothetical protein
MIGWIINVEQLLNENRRTPVLVPLSPPQIRHDLTWDWTRAAKVEGRRLRPWAVAQPVSLQAYARTTDNMSPFNANSSWWIPNTGAGLGSPFVFRAYAVGISHESLALVSLSWLILICTLFWLWLHLLTNPIKQCPLEKLKFAQSMKKIVDYTAYKSPPLLSFLSHINLVRIIILPFVRSNLILSSQLRHGFSFRFFFSNKIYIAHVSCASYMPRPSYLSSFDHPSNIWWRAQIIKAFVVISFTFYQHICSDEFSFVHSPLTVIRWILKHLGSACKQTEASSQLQPRSSWKSTGKCLCLDMQTHLWHQTEHVNAYWDICKIPGVHVHSQQVQCSVLLERKYTDV